MSVNVARTASVSPGRMRGDGGVALPFIAVMLLILLAFVAFAVDIGAAFAVRRQSQSAADSAVLGAAQEILDGGTRAGAASYAKELSFSTVAMHPTAAEWEADFAGCTDPGALAATAPSGGITSVWTGTGSTGCVSFSANNQRVRVRIPTQNVSAAFAQLVGVDTFEVSTSAEAVINFTAAGGGALPYAIPGNAAGEAEVCLNSGAGNLPPDVCEGGTTGNYGPIDWSIYGNQATTVWLGSGATGTISFATGCSTNSSPWDMDDRLALNNMLGVDHPLGVVRPLGNSGTYDPADVRDDQDICVLSTPPDWFARPNQAPTLPGNDATNWWGGTTVGLINGMTLPNGTVLRGRLDRHCGDPGPTCETLYRNGNPHGRNQRGNPGSPVDDTPLWSFLSTDLVAGAAGSAMRSDGTFKSVPPECLPSAFAANPSKAQLILCFAAYDAGGYANTSDGGTVLFGKDSDGDPLNGRWDIMAAPRFGFVPLLWNDTLPSGASDSVRIRAFRPVYFQTMLFGCSNGSGCKVFNPGEPWSPMNAGGNALDSVSAMNMRLGMLPVEAREIAPTGKQDLRITLVR